MYISRAFWAAVLSLVLLATLPLQGGNQTADDPCLGSRELANVQGGPDIEAVFTNQWGSDPAPIKIFNRDAALGEVVAATLDEYDEKYALRSFEDPLPVHAACPGYGYYRDADMSIISRISVWSWRQVILIRHAGGRGFKPGSEGYVQLLGDEWTIADVLTHQGPDNSYYGFGINIDIPNSRIEWQGRGGCPACACRENMTMIAVVVEKKPVGPTYTQFTSTRSTDADIEAAVNAQWGSGAPPNYIFGQLTSVGQAVTGVLNPYDEKFALHAFEDPMPVYGQCPGYGYWRDGNMSIISRITIGQGRQLILVRHTGARGYHPGSEGYVQLGNDWEIEKIVSAKNDNSWSGYGVRIDIQNGTIEWQGRTGCPGCACLEGPAFISVVVKKRSEIEATVDIDPDTLNRKSKGKWVTATIQLPEGYDPADIDTASIAISEINGTTLGSLIYAAPSPTKIGDHNNDGIPDLMVKFQRKALIQAVTPGDCVITLIGQLSDGTLLNGSDTIRVIH